MGKKRFNHRTALITGCGNENAMGFVTAKLLGLSGAAVAIT
jgi:enoyl-[acyl-carrier-protein] reductase (NADH)